MAPESGCGSVGCCKTDGWPRPAWSESLSSRICVYEAHGTHKNDGYLSLSLRATITSLPLTNGLLSILGKSLL